MNLVAYDTLISDINKNKTWGDPNKKIIISREIPYRKYVSFGKRYDKLSGYIFFIILTDDPPNDRTYNKTLFDSSGRIRIALKNVWDELGFNKFNFYFNVPISHTEHTDDGDIFEIVY